MKKAFFWSLLLLFLMACQNEEPKREPLYIPGSFTVRILKCEETGAVIDSRMQVIELPATDAVLNKYKQMLQESIANDPTITRVEIFTKVGDVAWQWNGDRYAKFVQMYSLDDEVKQLPIFHFPPKRRNTDTD